MQFPTNTCTFVIISKDWKSNTVSFHFRSTLPGITHEFPFVKSKKIKGLPHTFRAFRSFPRNSENYILEGYALKDTHVKELQRKNMHLNELQRKDTRTWKW